MRVSFDCSTQDSLIIHRIAKRAIATIQAFQTAGIDRLEISMDVTCVHANGCPLDLQRLLAFDDFSFAHDIIGIRRHLNRTTGKLEDSFTPRSTHRARRRAA